MTSSTTRERLKRCYLELLSRQNMEKIKVIDLCESACIKRSTFYSYYHRLDDLVDDLIEDMFRQIDPSCCKYLHYDSVTYQGGIPPCEFVRTHRSYLLVFLDETLSLYFVNKATSRYIPDAEAWTKEMGLPKESAAGILSYLLHGCFFGAVQSISLTDEEWERVRCLVDEGINYVMDRQRQ